MPPPEGLQELVAKYELHRAAYLRGGLNETETRREFIDPLLELLGWDIGNKAANASAYKDVVHEDSLKVEGATKAPDYSFRIGGTRKFFVEAKKPAIDITKDSHPAFQLRRYAWSAQLPVSILTNFEDTAVYDCRVKPHELDIASHARIARYKHTDLVQKWDEIEEIFSRESILKGRFDTYAASKTGKAKKGTAEVDEEFLTEIEHWRDELARNIALRNATLNERELNFAVHRLIDRIVFLRICEDRGIEPYGRLQAEATGAGIYPRLLGVFKQADARYNSGLFHFAPEKGRVESPDRITPRLSIDDKLLRDMIGSLYYPSSPYEFSVLPADILGQVYEQFLGKVIRLLPNHRAQVEEKPEVKKAGGVYYTPGHISETIVGRTLGALLTGRRPGDIEQVRVLDPACGSGSFLIVAYQRLLDWHREFYVQDGVSKHPGTSFQGPGGEWKLTSSERKRILLNNIYGVDIDPQAVEVTKLSLLLKLLEGETEQALSSQIKLLHTGALPDLGSNIKCGNSLVGQDYFANSGGKGLSEDDRNRLNAFDWEEEFPDVLACGGFDVVIGNPPYDVLEKDRGGSSWPHASLSEYGRKQPRYQAALGGSSICHGSS